MDNKKQKDFKIYQWLFFTPFSIIGAAGVIVVAFMALFTFICWAKYVVASFMLESAKIFPAIVLTAICLCVVAILVYSDILLVKKYIKSIKEFIREKNELFPKEVKKD